MMTSQLDGSTAKQLLDQRVEQIQIAGEWLYFRGSVINRIRLDGSGLEEAQSTLVKVKPDPPGTPVVTGLGTINANINGGSRFIRQGERIFGVSYGKKDGIYRSRLDGSEKTYLTDIEAARLNLVGDWFYYLETGKKSGILRIKTDGTDLGVIYDSNAAELIVQDNWIYFADELAGYSLSKIKIDGTGLTRLNEGGVGRLFLEDGWLYWSGISDYREKTRDIHRVRTDGSGQTTIFEGEIDSITVGDGYIFYRVDEPVKEAPPVQGEEPVVDRSKLGGTVYRMATDGSGKTEVFSEETASLSGIYKGWLYYFNANMGEGLIRVKPDGSGRMILAGPGSYNRVNFVEDQIIFYDDENGEYHIMDLDGQNQRGF